MSKPGMNQERLIAIFILGGVLFNYPILSLFNTQGDLFGIPTLYCYVFLAWAFVIGLVAWIAERD